MVVLSASASKGGQINKKKQNSPAKGRLGSGKMGSVFSKTKKKREGLHDQTKAMLTVDPREDSPPHSPKNLSSTLSSSLLVAEFTAFLAQLDAADSDPDEPGRVLSLKYILDIRELHRLAESERGEFIWSLGDKYFKVPGQGLVLENNQLWVRCGEICRSKSSAPEDMKLLDKARDAVVREIEDLHVVFLANRNPFKGAINCLL